MAAEQYPHTITVIRQGKTHRFTCKTGTNLLDAARQQGVRLPFSCRLGNCGACMARVTEGRVRMWTNNVLTEEEVARDYVLVCQSEVLTEQLTLEYDR